MPRRSRVGSGESAAGAGADARQDAAGRREEAADMREVAADRRDERAAERDRVAQLRELEFARSLLESAPDATVIVNADGIIEFANSETERMFGYRRHDLVGRNAEMLLRPGYRSHHADEPAGIFSAPQEPAARTSFNTWGCREDGGEFAVEIRRFSLETEQGLLTAAAIRDVTERQQAEQFREAVMDNMAEGLFVTDDEDRLTYMNAAAESILGFSGEELRGRSMHEAIHYQHLDGSSFPAEECEMSQVRTTGSPVRRAQDAFTRKDGTILPVAYSAARLDSGAGANGVVVVFRDTTEEQAQQTVAQRELNTLTWVGRIRDALDDDRMLLYAQPIVSFSTHAKRSEELLLRMVGRNGEVIPPGSFLPVAERYGQIREIDRWVITQAALVAATGRVVHANLSADSIGHLDLIAQIERELSEAGASPSNVVFEITETALMGDVSAGEAFTRAIVDIGSAVALDDFGTGYGSFTYLQKLHIAYLKIDISFVRDLIHNATNQHLVKAIVNIARGLGQQTIAEGVDSSETLALLTEYGVDQGQGFYLGRPERVGATPSKQR